MNQRERNEKHCWIFPLIVMAAFAAKVTCGAQIWPCPGICFTGDVNFPRLEKGVVLLDMGIPQTERPSVYGLSFSFWRSHYEEKMMGIQFGLVEAVAADAYGIQLALANDAGRGAGVQLGLFNIYDDTSFRLQAGLWNSYRISLNWNYGRPTNPGGYGVQLGLVNMSSEGGHLQLGFLNFADKSTVFQFGFYNNMDKESRGLQIGIINEVGNNGSPLIGWNW